MSDEERNDSEAEEMEHDSQKSDGSDIEDSDRSSSSETEESSDLDEETIDDRKHEYNIDLHEIEQTFQVIKRLLYEERMKNIEAELSELREGRASGFLKPLQQLKEKMQRRKEVAAVRRRLQLDLVKVQYESEQLAAHQNLENEKLQLFDTVRGELEEKIRRLEEDRNSIDIHSDLWESQLLIKKPKKKIKGTLPPAKERRKKPTPVSGPYIIYMLPEMEILEDWTLIKKSVKQQQHQRRKGGAFRANKPVHPYLAKYEDGKLNYQGDYYSKGHHIIIDNKEDSPVHATVTAINTGEIWVKKADGNKSKLYIAQLQKGKYTIRHVPYRL